MTTVVEKLVPASLKQGRIFTYEDIGHLPEGLYEIIDGERRDMTPTGFRHGKFESIFVELLRRNLKDKGYVAVGEVGIVITKSPLTVRAADVVYISKKTSPIEPEGMLEIPPDLIIEIISENNTQWEINEKVKDYLSIGVKRVIWVDPFTETITVFQHGRKEAIYLSFDDEFELIDGVMVRMVELLSS
jgi:Uma2 family endonuclease